MSAEAVSASFSGTATSSSSVSSTSLYSGSSSFQFLPSYPHSFGSALRNREESELVLGALAESLYHPSDSRDAMAASQQQVAIQLDDVENGRGKGEIKRKMMTSKEQLEEVTQYELDKKEQEERVERTRLKIVCGVCTLLSVLVCFFVMFVYGCMCLSNTKVENCGDGGVIAGFAMLLIGGGPFFIWFSIFAYNTLYFCIFKDMQCCRPYNECAVCTM